LAVNCDFAIQELSRKDNMKKQINPTMKAYLIRGVFYLLLLLAAFVILLALGQQSSGNSAIDPTKGTEWPSAGGSLTAYHLTFGRPAMALQHESSAKP